MTEMMAEMAENIHVVNYTVTEVYPDTTTPYQPVYISLESYEHLQSIKLNYSPVHGYLSVTVCIFGIIANLANYVVLSKKNMRTSTNVILKWLAVADLFTMLDYVPFAIKFYIAESPYKRTIYTPSYAWMCYMLFHADFSITMHSVSIWLTIVLALFRVLYIFFPAKGSVYCSIKHAQYTIVTVFIANVIVSIPNYISNYWESEVKQIDNVTQVTNYYFSQRNEGDFKYVFNANYWLQAILIKLLPCLLITLMTILLISALHKAHRHHVMLKSQGMRKAEEDKHNEHFRTTAMLLAVVILFLITELPQGILTLLMIFMNGLNQEVYDPLGDILDIAALINNAINFVLYCTMSRQFRDTFTETFCWCFPGAAEHQRDRWTSVHLITARNGKNGSARKNSHSPLKENGEMV